MNWNFIDHMPVNEATERFYDIINDIIATHVPRCTTRRRYPVWYTFELINVIRKKCKAHFKWKRTKNQDHYSEFSTLRNAAKNMIKICHFNFLYNLQLNITRNIKSFWAYTKSKRKTNSYPSEFSFNDMKTSDPSMISPIFFNLLINTHRCKSIMISSSMV